MGEETAEQRRPLETAVASPAPSHALLGGERPQRAAVALRARTAAPDLEARLRPLAQSAEACSPLLAGHGAVPGTCPSAPRSPVDVWPSSCGGREREAERGEQDVGLPPLRPPAGASADHLDDEVAREWLSHRWEGAATSPARSAD